MGELTAPDTKQKSLPPSYNFPIKACPELLLVIELCPFHTTLIC